MKKLGIEILLVVAAFTVILTLSGCASIEESRKFHLDRLEAELEMLRQMPKDERAEFLRELTVIVFEEDPEFANLSPETRTRAINLTLSWTCNRESFGKGVRARYAASLTRLAPEDRSRISEATVSLLCETLMP